MKGILAKMRDSKLVKIFTVSCITSMLAVLGCICAFAEESQPDLSAAVTTGFNNVQVEVFKYVAIVLPVGLGIFAAFFGIKAGIRFFRTITH